MAAKSKVEKRIDELLRDLAEKYGADVALYGNEVRPVERLSCGVPPIDAILGGGWPMGRISELWGPESAGKSTVCFHSIASAQRIFPDLGLPAVYFDLENTFDPSWAALCGVQLEKLKVIKAVAAEDVGDLMIAYVKAQYPLVVVDSVIEMLPEKVLKKDTSEHTYSPVAAVLSSLLPKLVVMQSQSPTTILLTNQVRDKVGFMFGEGQKAPGGHALFHLDSIRVRIQRSEMLKEEGAKEPYGKELALKVVKTKVGVEGRECRVRIRFGKGMEWDVVG